MMMMTIESLDAAIARHAGKIIKAKWEEVCLECGVSQEMHLPECPSLKPVSKQKKRREPKNAE
jgi:hypothetical protein